MARIETYPLDGNISVNDYVIGTDGDSLNATKNYKVLTFLDYLGRLYNLNSTDLLFNYSAVTPAAVADGEVSTNNYLDGTILMSGVTNIYVSKISAFGQLVDDIINTTGSENLTIMFTDMGNRNNLGIFVVDSAVDYNANTINLTVTSSTAVGSISAGKVMGIRIGIGGASAGGDFVTINTTQTNLTGNKTWEGYHFFNTGFQVDGSINILATGQPVESSVNNIQFENWTGGIVPAGARTGYSYLNNDESDGYMAWRQFVENDIVGWSMGREIIGSVTPQPVTYFKYTLPEASGTFPLIEASNVFTGTTNAFVGVTANSLSVGTGGIFTSGGVTMNGSNTVRGALSVGQFGSGTAISLFPVTAVPNYTGATSQGYFAAYENGADKGFFFVPHTNGNATIFNIGNATQNNSHTMPDKSGTVAHLDDIPALIKPYRNALDVNISTSSYVFDIGSRGNGKLSTSTESTVSITATNISASTNYPTVIFLSSTRVGGTTFNFSSNYYDKNGVGSLSVVVPEGESRNVHFVTISSSEIVSTNF